MGTLLMVVTILSVVCMFVVTAATGTLYGLVGEELDFKRMWGDEISELNAELEEATVEVAEAKLEIEEVSAEAEETKLEIEEVSAEVEEVKIEEVKIEETIAELEEALKEAKVELEGAKVELEEANTEVEEAKVEVEEAKVEVEEAKVEFEEAKVEFEAANAEFEEAVAEFKKVEAEFKKVEAEFYESLPNVSLDVKKLFFYLLFSFIITVVMAYFCIRIAHSWRNYEPFSMNVVQGFRWLGLIFLLLFVFDWLSPWADEAKGSVEELVQIDMILSSLNSGVFYTHPAPHLTVALLLLAMSWVIEHGKALHEESKFTV